MGCAQIDPEPRCWSVTAPDRDAPPRALPKVNLSATVVQTLLLQCTNFPQPIMLHPARIFSCIILAAGIALGGAGCATGRATTQSVAGGSFTNAPMIFIPTASKWNPAFWFGNVDDPEPPDWFLPNDSHRSNRWQRRNPCHNWDFYVMGIADKPFVRRGRFPTAVFNPNDGWNWAVCRYKLLLLPFISYRHHNFKFYCGWRERGNFGFKLTL